MEQRERPCFACKQPVPADEWHIHGGTEFVGSPTYGSGFDSVMQERSPDWPDWDEVETPRRSTRKLSLVVCDKCLSTTDLIEVQHLCQTTETREKLTNWAASDHPQRFRDYHARKDGEGA